MSNKTSTKNTETNGVAVTRLPPGPEPKPRKTPEEKELELQARAAKKAAALKAKEDAKLAREVKRAEKEAEAAAQKLAKKEARAAKKAAKEAAKAPAHLSKIAKAQARLPKMSKDAEGAYEALVAALPVAETSNLIEHLKLFVRFSQTKSASSQKLEIGDRVRILNGDPRFVGQLGTVTEARRIRCFVEVDGRDKPVYYFTSDVEKLEAEKANGTEG